MISNKVIGRNIKAARDAAHMTQEQVAERLGLSIGHYGHIERGTRPAALELLDKLCHLYQVRLEDLLAGAMTDAHKIVGKTEPQSHAAQFEALTRGCPKDLIEMLLEMCRSVRAYYQSH